MDTNPVTIELYKRGTESTDKYDYFIVGVIGAMFAYSAQHYTPHKLQFDVYLADPASLLILAGAFFYGLLRLKYASLAANINHRLQDSQDKAEQLSELIENPQQGRDISGKPFDPVAGAALRTKILAILGPLNTSLQAAEGKAKRCYRIRDFLLVVGFFAVLLAKVLQPYGPDAQQNNQPAPPMTQGSNSLTDQAVTNRAASAPAALTPSSRVPTPPR